MNDRLQRYKMEVLAKTSGTNIHGITNKLNVVFASIEAYKQKLFIDDDRKYFDNIRACKKKLFEIYRETRVPESFENLAGEN